MNVQHGSLDYLIRPLDQFGWHCDPNLPSRPEIDDQDMTRENFDRQIGWFGALKNLIHVCWNARERVEQAPPVGDQSNGTRHPTAPEKPRGQAILGRQLG